MRQKPCHLGHRKRNGAQDNRGRHSGLPEPLSHIVAACQWKERPCENGRSENHTVNNGLLSGMRNAMRQQEHGYGGQHPGNSLNACRQQQSQQGQVHSHA